MSWFAVFRMGLVQLALGAIVVLTTSTLNRVMVVELQLAALVPGLMVALHYAVQLTRPRMGFGSDRGGLRTPWIAGGMVVLALGGFGAAVGTAWAATAPAAGLALAAASFVLVGLGVSATGTSVLALLATRVPAERRAGAATLVWVMMIVGLAGSAGLSGRFLDPYSPERLVLVSGTVSAVALLLALVALAGVERASPRVSVAQRSPVPFRAALAEVWRESDARRFTVFVLVSMLAYSAQDLILEPFAGIRFGFTPGESTQLSGLQHGGTLAGMLLAAMAGRRVAGASLGSLRHWILGGCVASALALAGLVVGAVVGPTWPLRANVFALGVANGAFSIAAIGSMMALASQGRESREGTRMGLWGAAQAVSFAVGGVAGTAASDLARWALGSQVGAYGLVFGVEALLFLAAAVLALNIRWPERQAPDSGARSAPAPLTSAPDPAHAATRAGGTA
jgi:MFS transporter, BCD family, chlorophyll transporter